MPMVCPQCSRGFEQHLNCPDCGGRLLFQAHARAFSLDKTTLGELSQWQQTPWGRMAVGLILAQGFGYGLQQLLTAGILASGEQTYVWSTLWGTLLLHGLQGMCLLIGGALCGAGKQRGILYGSLVGMANGLIFLMVQRHTGETMSEIALYSQPVLHMAFGAIGGLIGTMVWKPVPALQFLDRSGDTKPVTIPTQALSFLAGPVYLGRVCLGIFVVVNGVVWSNAILNWVLNASQGSLEVKSHLQAQLIGWEVCALATLFGAGLAGANTFNGMKQGLCVGIGATFILAGVQLGNPKILLETTVFLMAGVLVLTIAGGWFGSQLFPPVATARPRKRILTG